MQMTHGLQIRITSDVTFVKCMGIPVTRIHDIWIRRKSNSPPYIHINLCFGAWCTIECGLLSKNKILWKFYCVYFYMTMLRMVLNMILSLSLSFIQQPFNEQNKFYCQQIFCALRMNIKKKKKIKPLYNMHVKQVNKSNFAYHMCTWMITFMQVY